MKMGHCFMLLHGYFNSAKYKYGDDEGRLSTHMRKVKKTLQNSGMDGPSFKTYWKFLCHFDDAFRWVIETATLHSR